MPRVELLPVTFDPDRLLMWADENFRRITDAIDKQGSAAPTGLSVPAGNVVAGVFGANVGYGTYTFKKLTVDDTAVDNFTVQGSGSTFKLVARDAADFAAFYRTSGVTKIWDSVPGVDRFSFFQDGEFDCHHIGVNGDNNANVGVKITTGTGGTGLYFDDVVSDTKIQLYTDYVIGVRAATMYFRTNGGNINFEAPNGSWAMYYGPTAVGSGVERGFNIQGNDESGERYARNWFRSYTAGYGWYNNQQGVGLMGNNQFGSTGCVNTQNDETQILARKISQGGWATAGLESYGNSTTMIPYMTLHANGCCTSSWRKDSGQSYMVVVNSGSNCDWVYAANHPVCSEEGKKHNISLCTDYGLKTLRKLQVKRFQYTPASEDEIWGWESWKHDRERGVWTVPPSEHMGWDTWHIGYMAEEMFNLVPEVVGCYADGKPKGIDYGNLIVVVIEAMNELADRIEDIEAKMGGLLAA